ncbi:MAG: single-stranded DNA-binding protein [Bacteroidales bacterium]|nr:single-stranded DNA-binding protein [Bacteroidales bacterium]
MIGVNRVILIGNLGKNPEIISFPPSGYSDSTMPVKKATFPLATTEVHKNRDGQRIEQTDWHNIVCWRGLAEVAEKILKKGTQVYIEGKLQTRSWEDKDGNKRYITEVIAENFTVLAGRNHNEDAQADAQSGEVSSNDPYTSILTSETEQMGDLPF